jgi:NlpC/P60 family putative phage cell wall peptidase
MKNYHDEPDDANQRDRIVAEARRWIATPYVHQTSTLGAGTDCLGLIRGIWRACIGAEPCIIPSYTMDWSEASGREALMVAADSLLVRRDDEVLMPGAVLLFRMRDGSVAKHLGVVSKTGPQTQFIHAYSGYGVVESSLAEPWRRRIARIYEFPRGAR